MYIQPIKRILMAIITIPSSIGGVTIPGGLISGPLGALFGKSFDQKILQYPRDLQSATKGHVVHFIIKEVDPFKFEDLKQSNLVQSIRDTTSGIISGEITSISQAVNKFGSLTSETGKKTESSILNFQPSRSKIVGNIFMYMPDTVNFSYGVTYDTPNLMDVGGRLIENLIPGSNRSIKQKNLTGKAGQVAGAAGAAITSATSAAVNSGLAGLLAQKAGYAVNPQLQMLFQGIGFREYQMAFTFTPYSKDEAKKVDEIIKMFRKHAAPKIIDGSGGMFFIPPSAFGVQFMFNGQENKHLNKIQDSVITNIDVNYAPNGWAAYDDGEPVQTTLTLQFKEIALVDRNQIEKGY